jgi:hypothetical protein
MSTGKIFLGRSLVIDGSIHACTDNTVSFECHGCITQSTRLWTSVIGTPDNPVMGEIHRSRRSPNRSAHAVVITLICDAQSINARKVCQEPALCGT